MTREIIGVDWEYKTLSLGWTGDSNHAQYLDRQINEYMRNGWEFVTTFQTETKNRREEAFMIVRRKTQSDRVWDVLEKKYQNGVAEPLDPNSENFTTYEPANQSYKESYL